VTSSTGQVVRLRPRDWLDHVFQIGIVLKGIDGLLEVVGGLLPLLVTHAEISGLVHALTQHELSQDPRDLIASQLLHTANSLTSPGLLFAPGTCSCTASSRSFSSWRCCGTNSGPTRG
jgi:uncharacterized membrane protein